MSSRVASTSSAQRRAPSVQELSFDILYIELTLEQGLHVNDNRRDALVDGCKRCEVGVPAASDEAQRGEVPAGLVVTVFRPTRV